MPLWKTDRHVAIRAIAAVLPAEKRPGVSAVQPITAIGPGKIGSLRSAGGRATLAANTWLFSGDGFMKSQLVVLVSVFAMVFAVAQRTPARAADGKELLAYFGTYTNNGRSKGIYCYKL